jgi:hypothetical protein
MLAQRFTIYAMDRPGLRQSEPCRAGFPSRRHTRRRLVGEWQTPGRTWRTRSPGVAMCGPPWMSADPMARLGELADFRPELPLVLD